MRVNRQTFYYHFRDIYDLMEWTLENDIRDYLSDKSDFSEDFSLSNGRKVFITYINSFIPEKDRFFMHMTQLIKHIMRIFCWNLLHRS